MTLSKRKVVSLCVLMVLELICLDLLVIQSGYASPSKENLAGAIVSVKGMTYITSGAEKKTAKPGDSIYARDVLTTSTDSSAKVLLKDHSIIDLGASTVFKVDQYVQNHGADRQVEASMSSGTVRGAVAEKITGSGKFHLKTPTATMGVRGTEFVAQMERGGSTQVTVIQGQVEVAPPPGSGGHSVTLGTGQQVRAQSGGAGLSKTITLNSSALTKLSRSSKVADNTFAKAVTIEPHSDKGSGRDGSSGSKSSANRAIASSGNSSSSSSSSGNGSSSNSSSANSGSSGSAAGSSSSSGNGSSGNNSPSASNGGPAPAAGAGGDNGAPAGGAGGGSAANGGPAPASVGGGDSGAGAPGAAPPPPPMAGSTLAEIGTTMATAAVAPPPINISTVGIAGTINLTNTAAPIQTPQTNQSSTVTVIIH